MYAIVETGGKQFKVSQGDTIYVEKLDAEVGSSITLDKVFLVSTDKGVNVGTPTVDGAKVVAKVEEHGKGKKPSGLLLRTPNALWCYQGGPVQAGS